MGRDEEDIQRIIEKQLKKTEGGSPGRGGGEGGGGGGDTGGYFVKSQWLQEEADAVSRLARKASMDQTEKSVDRYLQAVLDRY